MAEDLDTLRLPRRIAPDLAAHLLLQQLSEGAEAFITDDPARQMSYVSVRSRRSSAADEAADLTDRARVLTMDDLKGDSAQSQGSYGSFPTPYDTYDAAVPAAADPNLAPRVPRYTPVYQARPPTSQTRMLTEREQLEADQRAKDRAAASSTPTPTPAPRRDGKSFAPEVSNDPRTKIVEISTYLTWLREELPKMQTAENARKFAGAARKAVLAADQEEWSDAVEIVLMCLNDAAYPRSIFTPTKIRQLLMEKLGTLWLMRHLRKTTLTWHAADAVDYLSYVYADMHDASSACSRDKESIRIARTRTMFSEKQEDTQKPILVEPGAPGFLVNSLNCFFGNLWALGDAMKHLASIESDGATAEQLGVGPMTRSEAWDLLAREAPRKYALVTRVSLLRPYDICVDVQLLQKKPPTDGHVSIGGVSYRYGCENYSLSVDLTGASYKTVVYNNLRLRIPVWTRDLILTQRAKVVRTVLDQCTRVLDEVGMRPAQCGVEIFYSQGGPGLAKGPQLIPMPENCMPLEFAQLFSAASKIGTPQA